MGAATLINATAEVVEQDRADAWQAAAGDTAAFERIYRRHVARIHSLCSRMLAAEEADDVTQEVFIRAWQKLSLFRGDAAFGTWLHRLAVNVILARRRTQGTLRARFVGGDAGDLPVPARRVRTDLRMDFNAAVRTLPAGAREVFLLHDVEGYKHEEIAGLLRISSGTSKSQLHRARMILREYLT